MEYISITKQLAIDRTLPHTWLDIIRMPHLRKRALISIGTTGFIQCSGILVINNYGPRLYATLGFGTATDLLYGAAWLTFALGMNSFAAVLNEHFPRNKFLATGVLGCMIVLSVEAGIQAQTLGTDNKAAARAGVAFLFLIEVPYDFFLNGMQFIYLSEIWPMHLRAKGMSLGVAMISLMNIIWLQSAPTAFEYVLAARSDCCFASLTVSSLVLLVGNTIFASLFRVRSGLASSTFSSPIRLGYHWRKSQRCLVIRVSAFSEQLVLPDFLHRIKLT